MRTSTLSKEEEHNQNPIPIATGNEIELEDWDRLQVRVRDLYHLGLAGWLAGWLSAPGSFCSLYLQQGGSLLAPKYDVMAAASAQSPSYPPPSRSLSLSLPQDPYLAV